MRSWATEPETWEFVCECERADCDERVVLSLSDYEALRNRRDLVLAPEHPESPRERERRIAAASSVARRSTDR